MKADSARLALQLFERALDLEPGRPRTDYLTESCGEDAELRREVERLLAWDERGGEHLEPPRSEELGDWLGGHLGLCAAGARVGSYTLTRVIGSGGMGTVYEAVQDEPHRTVALKMMRGGVGAGSAERRFRFEAELLGRLRHAGVAQIHEAGIHCEGESRFPYFAMELVEGARTLLDYCAEVRLPLGERLALFASVCEAVHHGHQRGVIHCDLKPGNILVDASGRAKVIDFGIARAADTQEGSGTRLTEWRQLAGTLLYMSPEQLDGDRNEIDTRSDVYALGVVLYELLCGAAPFDLHDRSITDAARVVREGRPVRLRARRRDLPPDLEWIVSKAMDVDRERRYGSAAELGEDLGRFLRHEPVAAAAPSAAYHLRRFLRRNRGPVVAVAAVVLALAVGLASSVSLYLATEEARRDAEREAAHADQASRFLQTVLISVDPMRDGRDVRVADLLARAADEARELDDAPEVQSTALYTLGTAYHSLGLLAEAEELLRLALERGREALGPDDRRNLSTLNNLSQTLLAQGRFDEAAAYAAEVLDARRALLGEEHEETLLSANTWGQLLQRLGRWDEAEAVLRRNLDARRRVFGAEAETALVSAQNLAELLRDRGELDEAERILRDVVDTVERVHGDTGARTIDPRASLSHVLADQGRFAEAEPLLRRSLELCRLHRGAAHPQSWRFTISLGTLLKEAGDLDGAEGLLREVVDASGTSAGVPAEDALTAMNNLALVLKRKGDLEEAEDLYRRVVEIRTGQLGFDHPDTLINVNNLARTLYSTGQLAEAEQLLRDVVAAAPDSIGERHWLTALYVSNHGDCLRALGRFDEAEVQLWRAHETMASAMGADHAHTESLARKLDLLYERWDRPRPGRPPEGVLGSDTETVHR